MAKKTGGGKRRVINYGIKSGQTAKVGRAQSKHEKAKMPNAAKRRRKVVRGA